MKIAVTYNTDGTVFQHFGHTEFFKLYEVEDGKVIDSEIVGAGASGHGALAGVLAEEGVDVLICGGIGGGAQQALYEAGIELIPGAAGEADAAVDAFLKGELEAGGANCDHHGEEHQCGHHEEEEAGCGHSCGHCGGGCHEPHEPRGKNDGKMVKAHYIGNFNDGTQFDSSYDRGEPLEFMCGVGMMIYGFDMAVMDMEVGEVKDVHLMPEEAYGPYNPEDVFTVEISMMPGAEEVPVGEKVMLSNQWGQQFPAKVTAKDEKTITFDCNDEMAGKELNFRIELVEVQE